MIEGMLFSAVGGILATALSGIVGNRADAKVLEAWRSISGRLKKGERPINHDLQRAIVRSYVRALLVFCNECQTELKKSRKQYEKELLWLEDKKNELEQKLKDVETAEYVTPPLKEFQDIEMLLTSEGELAGKRIDDIKKKLIKTALDADNTPACFMEKISKSCTGLFELMSLYFAKEIKENGIVRNIFEGQLLAKIDISLQGQKLTVDLIEQSLLSVAKEVSEVLVITSRTEDKVDEIAADVKKILKPEESKRPKIPHDIQALLEEGAESINIGKYEESRIVAKKALELAVSYDDKIAIARTNSLFAIILCQRDKDYEEATKLLKEALAVFRDVNSEGDIADTLGRLGDTAIDGNNFDEAKAFLGEALGIHRKRGDKISIAQDYLKLGWIDYRRGRDKEALALYDQALSSFFNAYNDHSSKDDKNAIQGIAGCYQNKGLVYGAAGMVADAETSYMQALEWMRKTGFQQDIAKLLYILSELNAKEAKYEDSSKYLDEAIHIYDDINNKSWLSRCLQLKGRVLFTIGKLDNAIEVFKEALESAEKSDDYEQEEHILSILGDFNLQAKKIIKAKEYFVKARDLSLREGLLDGYAASVGHLSQIAHEEKDDKERDRLLVEGIQTLEKLLLKTQAEPERAFITGQIGSFYEKMKKYREALAYYLRSRKAFEIFSNIGGIANCLGSIARIKGLTGDKEEEFKTYLELKALVDGSPYYDLISGTAINLGEIHMDKGNLDEAKSLLEEADQLCKQYNLRYRQDVRKSINRLNTLMELRIPSSLSFEQMIKEMFELTVWFPEAKENILRLWMNGRHEDLMGIYRSTAGLKFMICQDSTDIFLRTAQALWAYMDLGLQAVNLEFPDAKMDMIPFPTDKKMFFEVSTGMGTQYTVTSSTVKSETTGNTGVVIMGTSRGLPDQAYDLILSRSADSLLDLKVFFFPYPRHKFKDKVKRDLEFSKDFGLIPVYFDALPNSENINTLMSKIIELPVLSVDEAKLLRKQIRNVKRALQRLGGAEAANVQTYFNDFIYEIEGLHDDYVGDTFLRLNCYALQVAGILDNAIYPALVVLQ